LKIIVNILIIVLFFSLQADREKKIRVEMSAEKNLSGTEKWENRIFKTLMKKKAVEEALPKIEKRIEKPEKRVVRAEKKRKKRKKRKIRKLKKRVTADTARESGAEKASEVSKAVEIKKVEPEAVIKIEPDPAITFI